MKNRITICLSKNLISVVLSTFGFAQNKAGKLIIEQ